MSVIIRRAACHSGRLAMYLLVSVLFCAAGAPYPPVDLVARLVDSRTVILQWRQPPADDSLIVAYSVHYHCERSGELQKVVRNTSVTLTQLTPFTNYTFFIKAYNSRTYSGPSAPVSLFTGDDGTLNAIVSINYCILHSMALGPVMTLVLKGLEFVLYFFILS